jgi:hypothetical protein
MASRQAQKRVGASSSKPCFALHDVLLTLSVLQLTREYKTIAENPPPYITAHPSESNILEYYLSFPAHCWTDRLTAYYFTGGTTSSPAQRTHRTMVVSIGER